MAHATWSAHEVAMFAYAAAGTVALHSGTLQRLFRDMHAGIQHITSSPPVFQALGRDLAGFAPGAEWRFLDLVGPTKKPVIFRAKTFGSTRILVGLCMRVSAMELVEPSCPTSWSYNPGND